MSYRRTVEPSKVHHRSHCGYRSMTSHLTTSAHQTPTRIFGWMYFFGPCRYKAPARGTHSLDSGEWDIDDESACDRQIGD